MVKMLKIIEYIKKLSKSKKFDAQSEIYTKILKISIIDSLQYYLNSCCILEI